MASNVLFVSCHYVPCSGRARADCGGVPLSAALAEAETTGHQLWHRAPHGPCHMTQPHDRACNRLRCVGRMSLQRFRICVRTCVRTMRHNFQGHNQGTPLVTRVLLPVPTSTSTSSKVSSMGCALATLHVRQPRSLSCSIGSSQQRQSTCSPRSTIGLWALVALIAPPPPRNRKADEQCDVLAHARNMRQREHWFFVPHAVLLVLRSSPPHATHSKVYKPSTSSTIHLASICSTTYNDTRGSRPTGPTVDSTTHILLLSPLTDSTCTESHAYSLP